ncbi:MAG: indole-3-glycerol phosphate synthase TrpC [Pseudomonadales bacterium]
MSDQQATILQTILQRKHEEVAALAAIIPLDDLYAHLEDLPDCRGFTQSLEAAVTMGRSGVIAEIKKASPSKGLIRENFDPATIAKSYASAGACCLSVLTDHDFFQGSVEDLQLAREAVTLPVLRKDFMVNDYHIIESRVMGADCILLIVAAFDESSLFEDLYHYAIEIGLDVLIEVHNKAELDRALALKPKMIGVNNRDLHSFETSLETTLNLVNDVPEDCLIITESGIRNIVDVQKMQDNNVSCFLIGETFMRANDPGAAFKELFREY